MQCSDVAKLIEQVAVVAQPNEQHCLRDVASVFDMLPDEKYGTLLKLVAGHADFRNESSGNLASDESVRILLSAAELLRLGGAKIGSKVFAELAKVVQGAPTSIEFVRLGRLAIAARVIKATPRNVPDQEVAETYLAELISTMGRVKDFDVVFQKLKNDKKRAGKLELQHIVKNLTRVAPPKGASRDVLLREVRAQHVLKVRDAGKAREIEQLG